MEMGLKVMFKYLTKAFTITLFAASLSLTFVLQANAQQNPPQNNSSTANKPAEEIQNADVLILANVTARELKFDVVPNPTVEFPGKPERKTLWEADRQNLPQTVQPGVTYRNVGIQLRIASRFADIERIVSEALGEIPIREESLTTGQQSIQQNPPQSNTLRRSKQKLQSGKQSPSNQNTQRRYSN
jgi:hypothetical protein